MERGHIIRDGVGHGLRLKIIKSLKAPAGQQVLKPKGKTERLCLGSEPEKSRGESP